MLAEMLPAPALKGSPKTRPKMSAPAAQARALQKIVMDTVENANLKPAELSGLVRAWCDINEERRKLKMQPLPRSIDVSKLTKRGRGRGRADSQLAEPVEPGPVEPKSRATDSSAPADPTSSAVGS